MAIRGVPMNDILLIYKVTKPSTIAAPAALVEGFTWSPPGSAISRAMACDAIKSRIVPKYFVNGALAQYDIACVIDVLQQWLDGAPEPLHAE